MAQHEEMDGQSIVLSVAFTPGSLSLSAYALTPKCFEWARNADINNPVGYNPNSMVERAQLLLSDRILGSTFAPVGGTWNYSLSLGAQFTANMPYSMTLVGAPEGYWSVAHRTAHFSQFIASGEDGLGADIDDNYA